MIKVGSSFIRKFQFFEVVNESEPLTNSKSQSLKGSMIKNENKGQSKEEINTININDISEPKQMECYDNYIFINGSATHKKSEQIVRENLIMKMENNKILDEYYFFNLIYYDFSIRVFEFNPYFIILGSNMPQKETKDNFLITKIKFYNGQYFLKEEKLNVLLGYEKGLEPYPQALAKEIKLLKRLEDGQLTANEGGGNMKLFETIQNINAFDINDNFVFSAVSVDKEGIILIYGFPNILSCENKNIIMKYLPKISNNEKEVNVTNIKFSKVLIPGNDDNTKTILYVATGNSIFYYLWDYDPKKNSFPNNIQYKILVQDKSGAYNSPIQIKDFSLLIGNNKMLGEYNNLQLGQTWFFEGQKKFVNYFNNYIYFVISGEEENSLQIFDKANKFFVYQNTDKNKIKLICNDSNFIYIFYEETPNKKYIVKLKEKNNKEKFETFFQKKYFDDAVIYAKNLNFDEEKISEISKKQAQYEFSKGHYDKSIEEYIKTINYYEPSIVIQKFLDKSKFDYLVKYLEAIVDNFNPNNMDIEECKNYTNLLLHCYIMREEINKLKDFIDNKGQFFSKELIKVVVDVCVETDNADIGLYIAKKHDMVYDYLNIMLTKLKEYQKVVEILEKPEKHEFKFSNKEKVEFYLKFSGYYLFDKKQEQERENGQEEDLADEKEDNDYSDIFFESVLGFIEKNRKDLEKRDIIKLIELFLDVDKFFIKLFDLIGSYDIKYNKEIIHRRILLYLKDYESERKNKNDTKKIESDIVNILKNDKFKTIYDSQYLIMLFKTKNFLEGIEVVSRMFKYNQDLLSVHMQRRNYKKIINICGNLGYKELSFWSSSLKYFLSKDLRKKMSPKELNELNEYFEAFLIELLKSKIIPAVEVLDMIKEQNYEISYDVLKLFMKNALDEEIDSIDQQMNNCNEYENKIDNTCYSIKELQTKAKSFNISNCYECGGGIDVPCYAFYCGHAVHKSCYNISEKGVNIECHKCKEEKKGIKDEFLKNKNYEKQLTSSKNLENVLEHQENKIDFLYELYGKGLFDIKDINQEKK